eukprot:1762809-Rhodomonas_salina.3
MRYVSIAAPPYAMSVPDFACASTWYHHTLPQYRTARSTSVEPCATLVLRFAKHARRPRAPCATPVPHIAKQARRQIAEMTSTMRHHHILGQYRTSCRTIGYLVQNRRDLVLDPRVWVAGTMREVSTGLLVPSA